VRLRRSKRPAVQPDHARYLADVALTLQDGLELHEALPVDRETLLMQAQRGALAGRGMMLLGQGLADELPPELTPYPALRALERLTCSLVAHAQTPPDPTGALRPQEVETVVDDSVRGWMTRCLPA
jgi:hypothetical protein